MFPLTVPQFTAAGNIRPNRFLVGAGSGNGNFQKVIEATGSTVMLVGVSQSGVRGPQPAGDSTGSTNNTTYLAVSGNSVPVSTALMEGDLLLGDTVNDFRIPLTSDGSGRGIPQAPANGTTCWYGAIALEPGVSGDVIKVWVLPPCPTV